MKKFYTIMLCLATAVTATAQGKYVQNKPYIDLRPFHFGVLVGMHMQDIELMNAGPQVVTNEDGTTAEKLITCDQDKWDRAST